MHMFRGGRLPLAENCEEYFTMRVLSGTVQGLVIENGYTSIPDMAAALLPPLKPLFHSQSFNGGMLRVSGTANAT